MLQGNCSEPPSVEQLRAMNLTSATSGAPLLPLLEGQCLLAGDRKFLDTFRGSTEGDTSAVTGDWHRLWLDNLYLRYKRTPKAADGCALSSLSSSVA